jgi:putative membrane protein
MKKKIQFLATIFLITASCTYAQNKTNDKTKKSSTVKSKLTIMDDKAFVKEAAKGGMMEVTMGNEAKDKASNERVKNFGSMMVRDHTKGNEELKMIANKQNIALPEKDESMNHSLENKTGSDYDKAYINKMVSDHRKDISLFEKESRNGKDEEIKGFAYRMLPTLKMHLDSAVAIQSFLKGTQTSSK